MIDVLIGKLTGAFEWINGNFLNKRHVLDVSEPNYPYRWGWIDSSELLLLAAFKVFKVFVEQEHPLEVNTWETPEEKDAAREIEELYKWWTQDRKVEHDSFAKLRTEGQIKYPVSIQNGEISVPNGGSEEEAGEFYRKLADMEEQLKNKDDEMLLRLVAIRHYLFT